MILQKMRTIDRLIKIASYYNSIKVLEFYRNYDNKKIVDARAMVYFMCLDLLNYSVYEVSIEFKKNEDYILELLDHHKSEYKIINHYTRMYQNIETQFLNWQDSKLDLSYSIIKTNYDKDRDLKYENILNENYILKYKLEKLKIKNYV